MILTLDGRDLVPLIDAAQTLGLSYQAIYGRILAGSIPAERIDGRWFVPSDDLDNMPEKANL